MSLSEVPREVTLVVGAVIIVGNNLIEGCNYMKYIKKRKLLTKYSKIITRNIRSEFTLDRTLITYKESALKHRHF